MGRGAGATRLEPEELLLFAGALEEAAYFLEEVEDAVRFPPPLCPARLGPVWL